MTLVLLIEKNRLQNFYIQVMHIGYVFQVKLPKRSCNDFCDTYDSLNTGNVTPKVADKISSILFCKEKPGIKIYIKPVQQ